MTLRKITIDNSTKYFPKKGQTKEKNFKRNTIKNRKQDKNFSQNSKKSP